MGKKNRNGRVDCERAQTDGQCNGKITVRPICAPWKSSRYASSPPSQACGRRAPSACRSFRCNLPPPGESPPTARAALVNDICEAQTPVALPCRAEDAGHGCPPGMAQLDSAEPRALIPIPGCKPGLPSTDWTSCSYTADHVVGGALCIPLAMCAYLRANLQQHHGASRRPTFFCSHKPDDGVRLVI
jgi:hypothetical protein